VVRRLRFTNEAAAELARLSSDPSKRGLYKQVLKTLGLLEIDTRHPGLNAHEYHALCGSRAERIWEAYAQNRTPGAYRVFFHYGPDEGPIRKRVAVVTIVAITAHP
jgi:hypothetical protein